MRAATISAVFTAFLTINAAICLGQTDSVPWQTDLHKAMQLAEQQGKPVLIHFWTPTCQPCLKLERNVFNRKDVVDAMSSFIPVKINGESEPSIRAYYKVDRYPTDVVVLPNNDIVEPGLPTPQNPQRYISQLTAIAFRAGPLSRKLQQQC